MTMDRRSSLSFNILSAAPPSRPSRRDAEARRCHGGVQVKKPDMHAMLKSCVKSSQACATRNCEPGLFLPMESGAESAVLEEL